MGKNDEVLDILIANPRTRIEVKNFTFNSPHTYVIKAVENDKVLGVINFQEGPILENGVNGVNNEDLIAIVINRLKHFQNSEFNCRQNQLALEKFEEGLMWLEHRRRERIARGVEGTHKV
jgi:hypothetical protein